MALETAMENFSEKRGIIFGSKSPFPFAEVLALRMSEFREKSTLVIESFFHKPEITKNKSRIRDECLFGYMISFTFVVPARRGDAPSRWYVPYRVDAAMSGKQASTPGYTKIEVLRRERPRRASVQPQGPGSEVGRGLRGMKE